MSNRIHLGYEVGSGEAVTIPLAHMVVTGQTQQAGKTTALEALIASANIPAVAFVTKRGERSFGDAKRIAPYFRERADWQFVASVLEAAMRERLKFERAWIMRASKGASTLADVQRNVRELAKSAKGLSADVYMTLDAYLDIVVPRVARVQFANRMDLSDGLNVLDLSDRETFPPELQSLVMRSVLEWIYEKADGAITIIPEAWEFLPQGRGSPVKLAAIELIRKGAGLHNFVWLDSQDIGGVDKEMLRSCPVWLLGVQREANEIKRVLDNIPAGVAKPKPADIARLEMGQFYACHGRTVVKTYVQPKWMLPGEARGIAMGKLSVATAVSRPPAPITPEPIEEEIAMSSTTDKKLDVLIELMTKQQQTRGAAVPTPAQLPPGTAPDEEEMYQRFKARLMVEAPVLLKVLGKRPELEVEMKVNRISTSTETAHGMLALLISEGFMDSVTTGAIAWRELGRRFGYKGPSVRAYEQLETLTRQGFLTKEGKEGYKAVPGMKINITET